MPQDGLGAVGALPGDSGTGGPAPPGMEPGRGGELCVARIHPEPPWPWLCRVFKKEDTWGSGHSHVALAPPG